MLNFDHGFLVLIIPAAIAGVIWWGVPFVLPGLLSRVISTLIYPVRVFNSHQIPAKGGALLICNHVSYLDPSLILGSFRRPVRFLSDRKFYEMPFLHWICLRLNSIPIDRKKGPKDISRAFDEVRRALLKGDLICIFPEGVLTPTGGLLEFHRGFEVIMKKVDAPIIPVFIDMARAPGTFFRKFPRIRYPVSVLVGRPLASGTPVEQVRESVEALSLDANSLRNRWRKTLPLTILDKVKKHPFKFCAADAGGQKFCYLRFFSMALAWSRQIFSFKADPLASPEMIGILLPSSFTAAMAHVAIALAGKIPVYPGEPGVKEDIDLWIRRYGLRRVVTSRAYLKESGIAPYPGMIFREDFQCPGRGFRTVVSDALVFLAPRWFLIRFFIKGNKASMDDVAAVVPSEGDSAAGSGVMLTHGNIAAQIESLTKTFAVKTNDIVAVMVPLSRPFGLITSLCFPLGSGLGVVYGSGKPDAGSPGPWLKSFHGSIVFMKAPFLPEFLRSVSPEEALQVRKVVVEACPLPESLSRAFREKFGIFPLEVYGTSELSSILSVGLPVYVTLAEMEQQLRHSAGRIGYPVQGFMVKVVHPVTFKPVAPREEGVLLVRGAGVMKGYYDDPGRTSGVFHQGWYVTGDMAVIDKSGCFTIQKKG